MPQFNWSPGIGDPTIAGWLTVVLYFAAAFSCWRTATRLKSIGARNSRSAREPRAWWWIALVFVALGINKQLDLQTAFTELGRVAAEYQGWYGRRQVVQIAFIALVAVACVVAASTLLVWARHSPFPTWMALTGATLVLGYVLMRAASFHHIDRFIASRILNLRWNWVIEMGGISITLVASLWRQRLPHPVPQRPA